MDLWCSNGGFAEAIKARNGKSVDTYREGGYENGSAERRVSVEQDRGKE